MKILTTWFSFRGPMRLFEFVVVGFAPGILLGTLVMLADAAFDARGTLIYPFLAFSIWPASALLTKVFVSRRANNA